MPSARRSAFDDEPVLEVRRDFLEPRRKGAASVVEVEKFEIPRDFSTGDAEPGAARQKSAVKLTTKRGENGIMSSMKNRALRRRKLSGTVNHGR
jgi:hypothetical protein